MRPDGSFVPPERGSVVGVMVVVVVRALLPSSQKGPYRETEKERERRCGLEQWGEVVREL